MNRTEIIKALRICSDFHNRCIGCPYPVQQRCHDSLKRDAAELLELQEKSQPREKPDSSVYAAIGAELREITAQRDALLEDIRALARNKHTCVYCASACADEELPEDAPDCGTCQLQSNWRWRGMSP